MLVCQLASAQNHPSEPYQQTLTQAQIEVRTHDDPQAHYLGLQPLPFRWEKQFSKQSGTIHLTLVWNIHAEQWQRMAADGIGLGLTIPTISNRYRYRINQSTWHLENWGQENSALLSSTAHWHLLPLPALQIGSNTLEFEIMASPANREGISQVEIAEAINSAQAFQNSKNIWIYFKLLALASSCILFLIALILYFNRKQKFYWYSSIAELSFITFHALTFVTIPPITTWLWNAIHHSAGVITVLLVCLNNLIINQKVPKILLLSLKIIIAITLPAFIYTFKNNDYLFYIYILTPIVFIACTISTVYNFPELINRKASLNFKIYLLSSVLAFVFYISDYLFIDAQILFNYFQQHRLVTFGFFSFNLSLAMIMLRHQYALHQELIKTNHKILFERQRIINHILGSIDIWLFEFKNNYNHHISKEQLSQQFTHINLQLRLMIDALMPSHDNLIEILAKMRHRMQPLLHKNGIAVKWEIEDVPPVPFGTSDVMTMQSLWLYILQLTLTMQQVSEVTIKLEHQKPIAPHAQGKIMLSLSHNGITPLDVSFAKTRQILRQCKKLAKKINLTLIFKKKYPAGHCLKIQFDLKHLEQLRLIKLKKNIFF